MANLQQLAPELLIQILSSIDSPVNLFSLVAASSACFRTYSLYQRPILLQVLTKTLSSQLIREFLAIGSLPSSRSTNHDNSVDLLGPFVDRYFSTEPFDVPSYAIDLASAGEAYIAVNRLTEIYFPHATAPFMSLDRTQFPREEPPQFIPLSAAEKDRIQRAFYRYELYSRLFPRNENALNPPGGEAARQFNLFLRHMTPWELEELSCVHLFLVSMIAGFIEDLEDEVFDAVVSCPGVRGASNCGPCCWSLSTDIDRVTLGPRRVLLPASDSSSFPAQRKRKRTPSPTRPIYPSRYRPSDDIPPTGYVSFSCFTPSGLEIFGRDFRQDLGKSRFVGHLVSLGLGFILRLADAPSPSQRRMLIQSQLEAWRLTGREFLPEALNSRPLHREGSVPPWGLQPNDGIDLRDGPTPEQQRIPGFLFANRGAQYTRIHNYAGDIRWDSLRAIGYLFWDKARWQTPNAQRVMVMSWNFAQMASRHRLMNQASLTRFLSRRLSVEERLRGVFIPVKEMRRIEQEYGRKGALGCGGGDPNPKRLSAPSAS